MCLAVKTFIAFLNDMRIDKLFVTQDISDRKAAHKLVQAIGIEPELIEDPGFAYQWVRRHADPVITGKKVLLLTENKGSFLKKCPGTSYYTCCGYQILYMASYCSMDCAYCILQVYFHPPLLQLFVNHEAIFSELDKSKGLLDSRRIGTGEFTDSLIWEPFTDLTEQLVNYFADQDRLVLELKTKTTNIRRLKSLTHNRKTIVAWSLNTPEIIRTLEKGTASLEARLKAAWQCQQWGYPLAFHFDPMVIYPGWQQDYKRVIEMLFERLNPENMVWISMGTFRFIPALKSIIQRRFADTTLVYGEFIPGLDGKLRYLRPLREDVYSNMAEWIRQYAPEVALYLCMEDDCIWENSLGFNPASCGGLPAILDQAALEVCNLK